MTSPSNDKKETDVDKLKKEGGCLGVFGGFLAFVGLWLAYMGATGLYAVYETENAFNGTGSADMGGIRGMFGNQKTWNGTELGVGICLLLVGGICFGIGSNKKKKEAGSGLPVSDETKSK